MSEYEKAAMEWLTKHSYQIVEENEKVQGQGKDHKVRVHALSANKEYMKFAKVATFIGVVSFIALFAGDSIPALSGLMKDLGSIFGVAGKSFSLILFAGGIFFYLNAKSKINEHVWIEFKNYKRKINSNEIGKFYSAVEDAKKKSKETGAQWEAKYMMIFSSTGFSSQALKLAENHQIDCLTWKQGTTLFEREVWSQAEPETQEESEEANDS